MTGYRRTARQTGYRHGRATVYAWWILIFGVASALTVYLTQMPGRSFAGKLPPLTETQTLLRDALADHVTALAGHIGERNIWRYDALRESADYISDRFRQAGYRPEVQSYQVDGKTVDNIEVERSGATRPDRIIVVGAHYDTVPGSPGANDNGSGVAALLELARLFHDRPVAKTVRFVAFVNEEMPFFNTGNMGSQIYARRSKQRGERIEAMLSLETIGYYTDAPESQLYPFPFSYFYPGTGNFVGFVGNLGSSSLVRRAVRTFRSAAAFPSEAVAAPGWITGIGWSDHISFWQSDFPAIMITDTALFRYAHYHSRHDTPDKLDYGRLARVVEGMASVIGALAEDGKRP